MDGGYGSSFGHPAVVRIQRYMANFTLYTQPGHLGHLLRQSGDRHVGLPSSPPAATRRLRICSGCGAQQINPSCWVPRHTHVGTHPTTTIVML